VFENKVLRRIFGPTRGEAARGCRNLHSDELKNLVLANIIRMIIPMEMGWRRHVASMGIKYMQSFWTT
jgi:hypothetical protein